MVQIPKTWPVLKVTIGNFMHVFLLNTECHVDIRVHELVMQCSTKILKIDFKVFGANLKTLLSLDTLTTA